MTSVQRDFSEQEWAAAYEPKHIAFLLDRLNRRMRHDVARIVEELGYTGRFDPLTGSSFRLLSIVPDGGARVTDLALAAGMTKQALGQFVAMLEPLGYLTIAPDPSDRRVKIVARTPLGDETVRATNEIFAALDDDWRERIGPRRWATARAVMQELAVDWPADKEVRARRGR